MGLVKGPSPVGLCSLLCVRGSGWGGLRRTSDLTPVGLKRTSIGDHVQRHGLITPVSAGLSTAMLRGGYQCGHRNRRRELTREGMRRHPPRTTGTSPIHHPECKRSTKPPSLALAENWKKTRVVTFLSPSDGGERDMIPREAKLRPPAPFPPQVRYGYAPPRGPRTPLPPVKHGKGARGENHGSVLYGPLTLCGLGRSGLDAGRLGVGKHPPATWMGLHIHGASRLLTWKKLTEEARATHV